MKWNSISFIKLYRISKYFQLSKLLIIAFLAVFICQCNDSIYNPELNADETLQLQKGAPAGKDYGDLVICLRTEDGIPIYKLIAGEHGSTPYPQPIKFDELNLLPVKADDGTIYQVFELNEEGEVILEEGFIVKEADFGRLNLVRAPESVLNSALQEAKAALTQTGVTDIKTDASGRLVAINGAEDWVVNIDDDDTNDEYDDKTIDSPRENLAIYHELLAEGFSNKLSFLNIYFTEDDILTLAANALSAGADKTGNIIVDEVAYLNDWIIDWTKIEYLGPDLKNRKYFDFGDFNYNRASIYEFKYVKITTLNPDGTWFSEIKSLLNVINWTNADRLIDYADGGNSNITGFANAADDATRVLDFIHSSELIEYNPYFTP